MMKGTQKEEVSHFFCKSRNIQKNSSGGTVIFIEVIKD